jgi:hypothetical protein
MNPRLVRAAALLPLLVLASPALLCAQPGDPAAPSARPATAAVPALNVQRAAGAIEIDGSLDDAGWANAARMRDFVEYEPREGARPSVETEVLLAYDEANLYVGFIARDPEPGRIRATLQPRDRLRGNDDWVGILLDPYGDGSLGYYFLANPLGVQADLQMTSQGEDASIDFIYSTAGRITPEGYIVEMAIPFRSLRVPDRRAQDWGIMLARTHPRSSRHFMTWPSLSRNNSCQICQVARLGGIQGVRAGGNLELLPSLVASSAGQLRDAADAGSFEQDGVEAQASLGLKYTFAPQWTAEATLNPDFSQVESDAAQIDVNTTFALFYPERRPFFQEGMELYQTPLSLFYSRSINAPAAAAKLTGRAGRTSIGYVGARDEHTPFIIPFQEQSAVVQAGRSTTNVLRLQQNLGGSHFGALLADRRMDGGGSGTTASVDGMYRLNEVYSVMGHLAVSHTQEPNNAELSEQLPEMEFGRGDERHTAAFDGEKYNGTATMLWVGRNARTWSWNALYLGLSPTFRADAGFQDRNDFRRATVWTGVNLYPNRYGVERVTASLWGGGFWNFGGERQQVVMEPGLSITLPRQTQVGVGAGFRQEQFRGVELTGLREYSLWLESNFSDAVRFGFNVGGGRRIARTLDVPEVGDGIGFSAYATLKPMRQVVIEPSVAYEELRRDNGTKEFAGYIARTSFNFQYSRELSVRAVMQYNDFADRLDIEPLVVYQLNPFSMFYVGSTHGSMRMDQRDLVRTNRQFFAKVQYLFRR